MVWPVWVKNNNIKMLFWWDLELLLQLFTFFCQLKRNESLYFIHTFTKIFLFKSGVRLGDSLSWISGLFLDYLWRKTCILEKNIEEGCLKYDVIANVSKTSKLPIVQSFMLLRLCAHMYTTRPYYIVLSSNETANLMVDFVFSMTRSWI